MPITLNGDTGIQTPMYNGTITANAVTPSVNMKNRIINGAMVINQRALGTVTVNSTVYTTDRWQANQTAAGKYSVANSTTAPTGFTNSYLATSLSAYSVSSSDIFFFQQNIEGYNIADLGWGTANAKTVTLSFWVQSSLTGTFGGVLANSAHNRSYPFSYTISAANTWEQKSITIAGDTTGTWLTDNNLGVQVIFGLGGGSTRSGTAGAWAASTLYTATGATSVVGTNGATFYITGVQLEVGSTATSFDYRPYGTELLLCQRYCEVWNNTAEAVCLSVMAPNPSNTFQLAGVLGFTVQKRTSPSISYSGAGTFNNVWLGNASTPSDVGFGSSGDKNMTVNITSSTNQGSYSTRLFLNAGAVTSNYVIVSAEL